MKLTAEAHNATGALRLTGGMTLDELATFCARAYSAGATGNAVPTARIGLSLDPDGAPIVRLTIDVPDDDHDPRAAAQHRHPAGKAQP